MLLNSKNHPSLTSRQPSCSATFKDIVVNVENIVNIDRNGYDSDMIVCRNRNGLTHTQSKQ